MKKLLLLITIFNFSICLSQELKKMKGKGTEGWEKYYVLKSDNTIRHGKFEINSYTPPFNKLTTGFYKNGVKDSLWTEKYNLKGHNIRSQGYYKNDKKIGIWIYNDSNGEIIQKYDHDNDIAIFSKECSDIHNCPASIVGGLKQLAYDLANELMWYEFPLNENGRTLIQFRNTVSLNVEIDGSITNVEFVDPITDEKLNDYLKKKIDKRKGKWIVARKDNIPIRENINIPVAFTVQF
jgi:antitoxin component YwqK of YwqJK toxin-antitoxin module